MFSPAGWYFEVHLRKIPTICPCTGSEITYHLKSTLVSNGANVSLLFCNAFDHWVGKMNKFCNQYPFSLTTVSINVGHLWIFMVDHNGVTMSLRIYTLTLNSSGRSDAIWRHRSGSTLAQVMACCLTVSSHYLIQCWLIITKVQWCSSEGNLLLYLSYHSHQSLRSARKLFF